VVNLIQRDRSSSEKAPGGGKLAKVSRSAASYGGQGGRTSDRGPRWWDSTWSSKWLESPKTNLRERKKKETRVRKENWVKLSSINFPLEGRGRTRGCSRGAVRIKEEREKKQFHDKKKGHANCAIARSKKRYSFQRAWSVWRGSSQKGWVSSQGTRALKGNASFVREGRNGSSCCLGAGRAFE